MIIDRSTHPVEDRRSNDIVRDATCNASDRKFKKFFEHLPLASGGTVSIGAPSSAIHSAYVRSVEITERIARFAFSSWLGPSSIVGRDGFISPRKGFGFPDGIKIGASLTQV